MKPKSDVASTSRDKSFSISPKRLKTKETSKQKKNQKTKQKKLKSVKKKKNSRKDYDNLCLMRSIRPKQACRIIIVLFVNLF